MNPLDTALLEAWNRLARHVRLDRREALRRALRRTSPALTRPVRPWCLCIRAADTRLRVHACVPKYGSGGQDDVYDAHEIVIDSDSLRDLCKPVHIPWPGIDWKRAAVLLGRSTAHLDLWIRRGLLLCKRYPARTLSRGRGRGSQRGRPVPHVWSPRPLDPNANDAAGPDAALWGTLWQHHTTLIPDDLEFIIERHPRHRPDPRGHNDPRGRFRGWLFRCPGLPNSPSCNRLVARLYLPLPVWTIADALNLPDPLDLTLPFTPSSPALGGGGGGGAEHSETEGAPPLPALPLSSLPPDTSTPHTSTPLPPLPQLPTLSPSSYHLACHHCHRIRYISLLTRDGWNHFITHLSGGLLYGRDVPRRALISAGHLPAPRRKHRYAPHPRKAGAPRRTQTAALLLRHPGITTREIAARMGVKESTVSGYLKQLYKQHGVRSRGELREKLRESSVEFVSQGNVG